MKDITLRQLEIFNAVVVAGSLTKASRRIGLSQPSISQQLAKLEEKLGCQLVQRSRAGTISLTPSGDYWFNVSTDMIAKLRVVFNDHDQRFVSKSLTLRLGATPSLPGHVIGEAARIATQQQDFIKFEVHNASTSSELVEMLRLHQINCALVSDEDLIDDRQSFAITELFSDPFALAVPGSVSDAALDQALRSPGSVPSHPALAHFVDVDAQPGLRSQAAEWYRHRLPAATPTLSANTYPHAFELVAAGLATCVGPLSILYALANKTGDRVRLLSIKTVERKIVLTMPKYLLEHSSYAHTYRKIKDYCQAQFALQSVSSQREMRAIS